MSGEELGWQVPGLREELVTELIRSLPKELRRLFVPAPDTARAVTARLGEPHGSLLDALARELGRLAGVPVPRDAFDVSRLPAHLRITYRVLDGDRELASGKDLDALRQRLRPRLQAKLTEAAGSLIRTGLRDWTHRHAAPGVHPRQGHRLPGAGGHRRRGGRRGCSRPRPRPARPWRRAPAGCSCCRCRRACAPSPTGCPTQRKLAMSRNPYPSIGALLDDCVACAADQVIADAGGPAWDADGFARLVAQARSALPLATARAVDAAGQVLEAAHDAEARLRATPSPPLAAAFADARAQFAALIYPGFVSETGLRRLPDLVRYLRAISRRLDTLAADPGRDAERTAIVHRVTDAYQQAVAELPPARRSGADVQAVRWMIEELRVSLFAQVLGTPAPVSEKRILAALDRLTDAR